MLGINDDARPTDSCFQQCRNSKPVRETVAMYQRHPSIEFTIKNIFRAFLLATTGYCSWKAIQIHDDPLQDPNPSVEPKLIITTLFASVILTASIAGPILRMFCNRNINLTPFNFVPNPFLVFTAVCFGIALSSKQQFNHATVLWNNISQTNMEISNVNLHKQGRIKAEIQNCLNYFQDNLGQITLPNCFNCHETWDPTPFTVISSSVYYIPPLIQTWVVHFNQTLCPPTTGPATPYWQYFTNFTFNETFGPWPCDPAWTQKNEQNQILSGTGNILAYMVGVTAPFSVTVTTIPNSSQGCVNAVGYGIQENDIQTICGYTKAEFDQLPSSWFFCLTEEAKIFVENYTSNFEPFTPIPSLPFPSLLTSLVQKGRTETPYIALSFAGIVSIFTSFFLERRCRRHGEEQQPLLAQNQQGV